MSVFGHIADDRDGALLLNSIISGSLFTSNETENLSKITVKLYQLPSPKTGLVKCAIYLYDAGGTHDLVAETEEINQTLIDSYNWYDFNFSGGSVTDGNQYFLVVMADYSAVAGFIPDCGITSTPGSLNIYSGAGVAYNGFPDPLIDGVNWNHTVLQKEMNIYCTTKPFQDMTLTGNMTWH